MTEHGDSSRPTGTVSAFDDQSGLGLVQGADGIRYEFHCIEIADGSRSIAVGASVSFDRLAKFGRYEAAHLTT